MNRKQRRAAIRRQQNTAARPPVSGSVDDQVKTGFMLQRAGRLAEAGSYFAAVLAKEPDHVTALQLMGVTQAQLGDGAAAVANLERAAELAPDTAGIHSNLGRALHQAGRLDDAVAACRRAIAADPDFADAYINLGTALESQGRLAEAGAAYEDAIARQSQSFTAHNNLGNVRLAAGDAEGGLACYRAALAINENFAQAHNNMGNALKALGRASEAEAAYRTALSLRGDYAEAAVNLAALLSLTNRVRESVAVLRAVIKVRPDHQPAFVNLGHALWQLGMLHPAGMAFERAIEMSPADGGAHWGRAKVLKHQGRVAEAIDAYRKAVALSPDNGHVHSDLIYCLVYSAAESASSIYSEARDWAKKFGPTIQAANSDHANVPEPERRLRIGYVSPNFRTHSVSWFMEPVLRGHDRAAFEIWCYADEAVADARTHMLRGLADHWQTTTEAEDSDLAAMVREDGIDILVDLAGHTGDNRLPVFAAQPAPVQVSWLGFPATTGLPTVHYRLTDARADPPGPDDDLNSESLVRLPGFLCYAQPDDAPDVTPREPGGPITFGSFNHLPKLQPEVVETWSEILRAAPGARLVLKSAPFNDEQITKYYHDMFSDRGIGADRLELLPWIADRSDHLAMYHQIDIGLDPFPYNGTTTTCEALWMGVPVVSLHGDRHAGRVGASLLGQLELDRLVAADRAAYVDTAVGLAADTAQLESLRMTLRERMRDSGLCDAQAFVGHLEAAYRDMWRRWCGAGENRA